MDIDGFMQDVDECFRLSFNAVDMDGGDTSGDVIGQDGEPDVLDEERFPGFGHGAQFFAFDNAARIVESAVRSRDLCPGAEQVFLLGVPSDKTAGGSSASFKTISTPSFSPDTG